MPRPWSKYVLAAGQICAARKASIAAPEQRAFRPPTERRPTTRTGDTRQPMRGITRRRRAARRRARAAARAGWPVPVTAPRGARV
jgi:hypothetical protein